MPLSLQSFKQVAVNYQTHKETVGDNDDDAANVLSPDELEQLRQDFIAQGLDDELFQQVCVVRKFHPEHVPKMCASLVEFRQQQGWKCRIEVNDIHPAVRERGAHTVVLPPKDDNTTRPMLYIAYGKVDPCVASPKDFQHEFQYAIQQASRHHAHGEIAVKCDFRHTTWSVLHRMSKDDLTRGMAIFHTFPVKVKHVYIVGTTWPLRLVMKAVLALASRKVREKVTFVVAKE